MSEKLYDPIAAAQRTIELAWHFERSYFQQLQERGLDADPITITRWRGQREHATKLLTNFLKGE